MHKVRTYKKYTLLYGLEKAEEGFLMFVEKSSEVGSEKSAYYVHGEEKELKALLCRLWKCGVTPTSFVYILEDEGYIPCASTEADTVSELPASHIIRRKQSCAGKIISGMFELAQNDSGAVATCGENE